MTVMVALAPKTSAEQRGLLYEAHDYRAADRPHADAGCRTDGIELHRVDHLVHRAVSDYLQPRHQQQCHGRARGG